MNCKKEKEHKRVSYSLVCAEYIVIQRERGELLKRCCCYCVRPFPMIIEYKTSSIIVACMYIDLTSYYMAGCLVSCLINELVISQLLVSPSN